MLNTERLKTLNPEEDILWLQRLGYELTIAARSAAYEASTDFADGIKLRAFNELQHRVYGRMIAIRNGHQWSVEDLLDLLQRTSTRLGIATEVDSALQRSLRYLEE